MRRGLANLQVLTCDINRFAADGRFDRVVSVEMFEHLRNWPEAFRARARLARAGRALLHARVRPSLHAVRVRGARRQRLDEPPLLLRRHDAERRPRAALPGRSARCCAAGAGTARTTRAPPRPGSTAWTAGAPACGRCSQQAYGAEHAGLVVDALAAVLPVVRRAVRLRQRPAVVGRRTTCSTRGDDGLPVSPRRAPGAACAPASGGALRDLRVRPGSPASLGAAHGWAGRRRRHRHGGRPVATWPSRASAPAVDLRWSGRRSRSAWPGTAC